MEFINETERQKHYMELCRNLLHQREAELSRPLSACIVTFGCQMNFKDSEKLEGILSEIGYRITDDEHADLVLYNTCTVRENANFKIYGRLGYISKIKEKNPEMIIGLCGCMMQEKDVVEKIKKSYRQVDIIFGTHNIYALAEILYERLASGRRYIDVREAADKIVEDLPAIRKYPFKSGVNIMYGCDNFCTYCIVPYVRGRERSRKSEDILNEIKALVKDGVKEVMLLGQNVNSYGKGLDEKITFADLVRKVNEIDGLERIRFMTSHPKDLSDDLIDAMASCDKVCKHMHLPLQSGSDELLAKMNRKYSKEDYLRIVDKLNDKMPGIGITTDIIVGFPGESEEDFKETLDVVSKVRYDSAFTFIYSKRTGTPAASMDNQIDDETIKNRFDRLLKLVSTISAEKTNELCGKTVKVLVEEKNSKIEGYLTGRLENNSIVHFKACEKLIGTIQDVKLTEAKGFYYMGELK